MKNLIITFIFFPFLSYSENLFSENIEAYLSRHRARAAERRGLSIEWIEQRISERIAARTARDWVLADEVREDLDRRGVILMDHAGGTDWTIEEARDGATTGGS